MKRGLHARPVHCLRTGCGVFLTKFIWTRQGFLKLLHFAMDNTVHVEIKIDEIFHITRHMNKPSAPASKQNYNNTPGTHCKREVN